jgi:hypothetical protein
MRRPKSRMAAAVLRLQQGHALPPPLWVSAVQLLLDTAPSNHLAHAYRLRQPGLPLLGTRAS